MNLPTRILSAINDVGPECSTTEIRRHMEKPVSIGRLYANLDQMEELGYVVSSQRPGDASRNHHPKRVFWLTATGAARLRMAEEGHQQRKMAILEWIIFTTGRLLRRKK